jgi:hypothetical protein
MVYKEKVYNKTYGVAPDPLRWNVWAAGYGGQNNAYGKR